MVQPVRRVSSAVNGERRLLDDVLVFFCTVKHCYLALEMLKGFSAKAA
jgi:hypothetical protein